MREMRKNKRGGRLGRKALDSTDKRARVGSSDGRAKTLPDPRYLTVSPRDGMALYRSLAWPPPLAPPHRWCVFFLRRGDESRLSRLACE